MSALELWTRPSLFDSFFNDFDRPRKWSYTPTVDVKETDENYLFHFDLPGMKKEDIHVEINGNQLVVSGERKSEAEENTKGYHRVERSYGRFQRSFQLPDSVDSEKIQGKYKDGVLELTVAKTPKIKPKKIDLLG